MADIKHETISYWDQFYHSDDPSDLVQPSQFAAFVLSEISRSTIVIDLGCGTGRDTLFFLQHGHKVLSIDASESALATCTALGKKRALVPAVIHSDIQDPLLEGRLLNFVEQATEPNLLLYARFFLHAITESGETSVLDLARKLSEIRKTRVAVEFRTKRDAALPKATAAHYRRYVDPLELIGKASALGLRTEYFVEGFGYAKWRDDDAHVARCILAT
jgi:SAM-dependent methyltransferase